MRYDFMPGRDVTVGPDDHFDIRLDPPETVGADPEPQLIPNLVLRFAGTHWLAVDHGHHGLFLDGTRMSTVDIRDGQTVAIGDPQRGRQLTFQVTAPSDAPAPSTDPLGVPVPPVPPEPTPDAEPETSRMPAAPPVGVGAEPETAQIPASPLPVAPAEPVTELIPAAPPEHSPLERPTRPFRSPVAIAAVPPPVLDETEVTGRGLVERMTEATRKLLPARSDNGPGDLAPQTGRLPLLPGARTIGVAAYSLGLVVDGREVLSNVSFTTRPGSLIAIVGPSAARNIALTSLLAGTRPLSSGVLTVDGHDVHAEPEAMRRRIGVVPRDNRVHPSLTVERAVGYAAELRLPSHTTPEDRARVVQQVLDELELTPHRTTRVAKLPPEARRCTSMAIELLTRPSLLVVDEPGGGLNPVQQNHVMALLRRQADLGCVVVVSSTSLAHLNLCDQVLLLTPAGRLAFAGPPTHIESALGTTDWFQIFARISADPHGAHHSFLMRQQAAVSPTPPSVTRPERLPPAPTFGQQFSMLVRRQIRLLLASPISSLLLLLLPFALGALTLLIPGDSGLGRPGPTNAHEALEILAALNFGAVILGTATSFRSLVAERRIFRREQAVGLSTAAYLAAKLIVFSVIAVVQAAILTAVVIVGKGGPSHGAVLLGNADVELYVSVAATAVVSVIVGLALSALGKSVREVLPLVIPAVLASLLFAGGLVSLVGTWGYDQVSWFIPAQWGFAAGASTVDLRRVDRLAAENAMWTHYSGWWVFDMLMLMALGAMWAGFVGYRLRRPTPAATSQAARTG